MHVEVRAAQPGDGAGLARIWLENARYYVRLFPDHFRMPDEAGLAESFETRLARPSSPSEAHLVALVDGDVAAFVSARLTQPDEGAGREMLADRPYRRVHVETLGTADAFQRQGLATQLVEAIEEWAREQGAPYNRRHVSRQPGCNSVLGGANGLPPPLGHPREASRLACALATPPHVVRLVGPTRCESEARALKAVSV